MVTVSYHSNRYSKLGVVDTQRNKLKEKENKETLGLCILLYMPFCYNTKCKNKYKKNRNTLPLVMVRVVGCWKKWKVEKKILSNNTSKHLMHK